MSECGHPHQFAD
jgi:hypothetical protein